MQRVGKSHWVADILVRFNGRRLSKRSGQGCPQPNRRGMSATQEEECNA